MDRSWHSNGVMLWLLGLAPLLAVTSTAINGLALGLIMMLVLLGSSACTSLIRGWLRPEAKIIVILLVVASPVAAIELVTNAYFHQMHAVLGIYLPLIAINCAIIGHADRVASTRGMLASIVHGVSVGGRFALVLMALGGLREVLGYGTLLAGAELLFGAAARDITLTFSSDHQGLLLAALPPGAFIGLGLLIALNNVIRGSK